MKRKLTIVLALALMLVTVLASCSSASVLSLGEVLNESAPYEDERVLYSSAQEVTELGGARVESRANGIAHFIAQTAPDAKGVTFDRHIVYNINNGDTLFTATESEQTDVSVSIETLEDVAFFVVKTTRWNLNALGIKTNVMDEKTTLYDATGVAVQNVAYSTGATAALDTVYFDGKCYRADEEGKLNYAFDYSVLSAFPQGVDAKVGDFYYDVDREGDKGIKMYDSNFKFVQEYEIPAYADLSSVIYLDGGKLLIQYTWELEEDAKDYDFIADRDIAIDGVVEKLAILSDGSSSEDTNEISLSVKAQAKYNVTTVLYDGAENKAKEIDCEYLFLGALIDCANEETYVEINKESALALIYAYPIVDKRVVSDFGAGVNLVVNEKAKFSTVDGINGETIMSLSLVESNRWIARTSNYMYLIDGEGNVLGEVSNARRTGKFIYSGNRIYDLSLSLIYNASENSMAIHTVLDGAFILKNYEGEYFCYTGEGKPVKLIDKNALETSHYLHLTSGLFVIIDAYKPDDINCEIYNAEGEKIYTIDYNVNLSVGDMSPIETEDAVLLPYMNTMGTVVYYRIY